MSDKEKEMGEGPPRKKSDLPQKEVRPKEESPFSYSYMNDLNDAADAETMEKIYGQTFQNITEGEVVRGRILQVGEKEVLIDVGYKSEGVVPIEEFRKVIEDGSLKVGDEIDVLLERTEDANGLVVLSKEKADKIRLWDKIEQAYERGEILEGKVIERIKGGLTVDIGVRAFLPGSQVDLRPVRNPESLIGQVLKMKVIKLNKRRGNIVLSRRVILEEERENLKKQTLEKLEKGKLVKGIVKNITEYGAFIDLGGIDGLLHITDMSWGRVSHPSELFMIGDEVEVMVLNFDRDTEKVSLGLKQKSADPWDAALDRYPAGSKVRGKVISLTDYGAFVELEEGIEGLVHISEMSWTRRIRHPSKLVAIGDIIEAMVLDMDRHLKRISLGMKQCEPNPWQVVEQKYPVGTKVVGKVRNLTNFGAFVELDEGIDGLIHISDMSWTHRVNHPSEVLKKGERVETVVLAIDTKNERLSLGLKQVTPDPWSSITERISEGSLVNGKVVKLTEFGAFVEIEPGIEGLVHISELDTRKVSDPAELLSVGQEIPLKVVKLDRKERRIGLSLKALKETKEKAPAKEHLKEQEPMEFGTLKDYIKDDKVLRDLEEVRGAAKRAADRREEPSQAEGEGESEEQQPEE